MSGAGTGTAAARALEALLRTHGAEVRLRVPSPAGAGDDGEQLGLTTPAFTDVGLGRGVFRRTSGPRVLLIAAAEMEQALTAGSPVSVEALLAQAMGALVGETLYGLESWQPMRAGEAVYGYALTLAERV